MLQNKCSSDLKDKATILAAEQVFLKTLLCEICNKQWMIHIVLRVDMSVRLL